MFDLKNLPILCRSSSFISKVMLARTIANRETGMLSFKTLLLLPNGSQLLAPLFNTTAWQTKPLVDALGWEMLLLPVSETEQDFPSQPPPAGPDTCKDTQDLISQVDVQQKSLLLPRLFLWIIISHV